MRTTTRRRIDGVVFARRPGLFGGGGLGEEETERMRYAMAWLLGVPGIVILLWMLTSVR